MIIIFNFFLNIIAFALKPFDFCFFYTIFKHNYETLSIYNNFF